MAAELADRWQRTSFDYLVNNAGFGQMSMFADTTEELYDRFHRVILKGPFFLTQTLLPLLADGGAIVNTTSNSALPTGVEAGYSAYASMKGGLAVLTRYLAKELSPRGIRVNAVAPGPTRTGMISDDVVEHFPEVIPPLVDAHRARPPGRRRRRRQGHRRPAVGRAAAGSPARTSRPPAASTSSAGAAEQTYSAAMSRLSLLLAAAMFVLVVDTSLMNVSISAVVEDLDTTASAVQSAIALEALVSAAFILISSKVGDLIGRKRAYVLGLLAYAIGALAMTLAQSLTAIIVFWAIIGGLGASLLLPAMQSLIHGNFEGAAQKKTYALVGAAAAIAAAVGPLLGGFVTTYLSWRVGFLLEVVIIAVVLAQHRARQGRPVHGRRGRSTRSARRCRSSGMGGVVLGILVWQEGGDYVVLLIALGALALGRSPAGSCGATARARSRCSIPTCSGSRTSGSGSPSRCCRTSRSAGR